MVFAPGEGRRLANWKASQGPATSIVSAPRPMMKATGILPWAGGVSFVVDTADELDGCWPSASPAREMKVRKKIDHLFSWLYMNTALPSFSSVERRTQTHHDAVSRSPLSPFQLF